MSYDAAERPEHSNYEMMPKDTLIALTFLGFSLDRRCERRFALLHVFCISGFGQQPDAIHGDYARNR